MQAAQLGGLWAAALCDVDLVMVVVVGGVDWSVILCIVWCLEERGREEGWVTTGGGMRMDGKGASKENGDGNSGDCAGIQPMNAGDEQVRPSSGGGVAGGIAYLRRYLMSIPILAWIAASSHRPDNLAKRAPRVHTRWIARWEEGGCVSGGANDGFRAVWAVL